MNARHLSKIERLFAPIWVLSTVGIIFSCKQNDVAGDHAVYGNAIEGSSYLWPNAEADVCWEKADSEQAQKKWEPRQKKIEHFLTEQLALAGFTLKGWKICKDQSKGMRIKGETDFIDGSALGVVKGFGRKIDGVIDGVRIMIALNEEQKKKVSCADEELCVLSTALHELGHGIGLMHEHTRADSACALDIKIFGDGGLPLGRYDPMSIMNYCAGEVNDSLGRPSSLSQGDIEGILKLYGKTMNFPFEKSCVKDGFKWATQPLDACCQVEDRTKLPSQFSYPLCEGEEPLPTTPKNSSQVDLSNHVVAPWVKSAFPRIKIVKPFTVGHSILSCREGQFPGNGREKLIDFPLKRSADYKEKAFHCYQLDVFESMPADSPAGVIHSKKMARMMFQPELTIPYDESEEIDLTRGQWNIHDLSKDPRAFPKDTKVPGADQFQDQNLQKLAFAIDPNGENIKITEGKLFCGKNEYRGVASSYGDTFFSSRLEPVLTIFKVPYGETCSSLQLNLVKTTISENGQSTSDELISFRVQFDKPLHLPGNNQLIVKKFSPPACVFGRPKPLSNPKGSPGDNKK